MSKKVDPNDIDDIDEESLRERMEASEKLRGERRKVREQSKKDRRRRVEKIIHGDNPAPLTQKDQLDLYKKNILEELEKREKLLEDKMKKMENKIMDENVVKNQEVEDKIVNNFINKLAIEQYNTWDDKFKKLSTSLNSKLAGLANRNKDDENQETKKIKSMFVKIQTQMKDMEKNLNKKRDISKEDDKQYDQLQDQINDMAVLLSQKEKENHNIEVPDLEQRINDIVSENVGDLYLELDKKIDSKLNQENRINEVLERISNMENVSKEKDNSNIDEMFENVIKQIQNNNDSKMEKMYIELRKRINNVEMIDDTKFNDKEDALSDLEKRLHEIENYKKKVEKNEERRNQQLEKQKKKNIKKNKKKKFSKLKNKILKKHNLTVIQEYSDDSSDDDEEEEIKKPEQLLEIEEVHPYIELLTIIKKKLPKILNVSNSKEIDNLYTTMNKKYERYRGKPMKKMNLVKNKIKVIEKKKDKKGYGVKRGIIKLDDREGERITIFKRYSGNIKDRFASYIKIYFQYFHNFNFSFKNIETKESFSFYYDDHIKPKMIVFNYKSRYGNELKKFQRQLKIGDDLRLTLENFEDNNGEHFIINFLNYKMEFPHMLRIMDIDSNCCFDVELECDDEQLFDI